MYPFIDRLRRRSEEQMEQLCALRGQCKMKITDKAEQWKSFKEQQATEWKNYWNADRSFKFGTGLTSETIKDGAPSETKPNEIPSESIRITKSRWSRPFASVSECSEENCKNKIMEDAVKSEPNVIETPPAIVANAKKSRWW